MAISPGIYTITLQRRADTTWTASPLVVGGDF